MAVMAVSLRKLVVLDTNLLLHMAEQHAPSHNTVLRLVRMGFMPIVVQTVVQELGAAAEDDSQPIVKRSAIKALSSMRAWGIEPFGLKPVGNGICDVIANVIANRGLLPEEERNDACVLIEAGFCCAAMVVTWDRHLLDADNTALNEVLKQFDLNPVQITSPSTILGY
jgi:hypothetical protein